MNNPMLQALGRQASPQMAQIRQMINTVKSAGNPKAMLNQMMQNNPQGKAIMDAINRNGGDPQKAFYEMAKQKGVDPAEILDMLKQ